MDLDDIAVVVMTRDRCEQLAQSLPRHEARVVVVDNGSTDGTADLVHRLADWGQDISLVRLPRNAGATARNIGVAQAGTRYVAFADDDSWWAQGALARAVAVMDTHPRLAVLAARVLVGPQERLDPLSAEMARARWGSEPDMPGPTVLGFAACGAVVRSEAFLGVGGFDDVVFFMGEEERVTYDLVAAGWGLAHVPDVVAHHHPRPPGDPAPRQRMVRRSALLTAWMRRPLPVALRRTVGSLTGPAPHRGAALDTLPRLPRALRARRVNPPAVESMIAVVGDQG